MTVANLPRGQRIVDDQGVMTDRMEGWTDTIGRLPILIGSGTPEASVKASITTLYMDTSGSAGSILYIKRDADTAGDQTKGWILV